MYASVLDGTQVLPGSSFKHASTSDVCLALSPSKYSHPETQYLLYAQALRTEAPPTAPTAPTPLTDQNFLR
jgi:hypothetical protein